MWFKRFEAVNDEIINTVPDLVKENDQLKL